MGRDDDPHRAIHARKFFDGCDVLDITHPGAAVLGRKHDAQQTELAEFFDRRQGKFAGFVPPHDVRLDFALGEFANAFLQLKLFIVELEIHDAFSCVHVQRRTLRLEHRNFRAQSYRRDVERVGRTLLSAAVDSEDHVLKTRPHPAPNRNHTAKLKNQLQRRRTGVSAPHNIGVGSRMNRSNTSFDSSLPQPDSRMTSPLHSSSPKSTHPEIVPVKLWTTDSLNSVAHFFKSTPAFKRRPKKKASSRAACAGTGVLLGCAPATYSSSAWGEAKRTAS